MASSDFELTGSRIANATRTWQANEDTVVTGYSVGDAFIFAAMVEALGHGGGTANLVLRWRNLTDAGAFAELTGSGELNWSATTDLVNGNAVTSGESGCTPGSGTTYDDGVEREGANVVLTDVLQNHYTEHQWAVNTSSALGEKTYEFEIYDNTAGASLGTCAVTITFAAAGGFVIAWASQSNPGVIQ
jgi:hypothetical protein